MSELDQSPTCDESKHEDRVDDTKLEDITVTHLVYDYNKRTTQPKTSVRTVKQDV